MTPSIRMPRYSVDRPVLDSDQIARLREARAKADRACTRTMHFALPALLIALSALILWNPHP